MANKRKKRPPVKDLARPKQDVSIAAAKRVKGGLAASVQKVKQGTIAGKGGLSLKEFGGLQ